MNQDQFDAAVNLLKQQKSLIGEYWADYLKAATAFQTGSLVLGSGWQLNANTANLDKPGSADTVLPKEGATAWSDTWMVSSKAKHPNCMYMWMNYVTTPEVQAQVAEWFGEAPANPKACTLTTDPSTAPPSTPPTPTTPSSSTTGRRPPRSASTAAATTASAFQDWTAAWNDITAS